MAADGRTAPALLGYQSIAKGVNRGIPNLTNIIICHLLQYFNVKANNRFNDRFTSCFITSLFHVHSLFWILSARTTFKYQNIAKHQLQVRAPIHSVAFVTSVCRTWSQLGVMLLQPFISFPLLNLLDWMNNKCHLHSLEGSIGLYSSMSKQMLLSTSIYSRQMLKLCKKRGEVGQGSCGGSTAGVSRLFH